jgi:hypothetical protein
MDRFEFTTVYVVDLAGFQSSGPRVDIGYADGLYLIEVRFALYVASPSNLLN